MYSVLPVKEKSLINTYILVYTGVHAHVLFEHQGSTNYGVNINQISPKNVGNKKI
ncbi:hypothetical protein WN55_01883 [Dufourea novaeangliae]|uniref:Uncharacterized protein n=1 Tax=Dufourea novaeangliae TaxID=178035 RepID=A0A154PG79_DUFNO|nr:hypothetical protein WN55_01883 [Dufourea novaeangliae]